MSTSLLILDTQTGLIIARSDDPDIWIETRHRIIPEPAGFTMDAAADWVWDAAQNALIHDPARALIYAQLARIARIKHEAADRIAALDWKVQRAQEREKAGWGTLADTAAVLADREAIRQSSDAAEAQVWTLTTRAEVDAFQWTVTIPVPAPRLLTPKQFAERFTDAEMADLMATASTSPAVAAWLERFRAAQDINLDAPMAQGGVHALEMIGLIAPGRAVEILS